MPGTHAHVPGSRLLPAAGPVLAACREAAARRAGPASCAEAGTAPGGIRVRFDPPGAARDAAQALRALGYQTVSAGGTVTVTGWDPALLAARAARLQSAARARGLGPLDWAAAAVTRFRQLQDSTAQDSDDALKQAVTETRLAIWQQLPPAALLPVPVSEQDLAAADGPVRVLLDQVAAGEARAAQAGDHVARLAETAIRVFTAERDLAGHDAEAAAAAAARRAAGIHGPVPGAPDGSMSVVGPDGRIRVLGKTCGTCISRSDLAETVIKRNRDADALLVCHSTLPRGPYPGTPPAVCAAYWARHGEDIAPGRLALTVGITRVPPPGQDSPAAGQRETESGEPRAAGA